MTYHFDTTSILGIDLNRRAWVYILNICFAFFNRACLKNAITNIWYSTCPNRWPTNDISNVKKRVEDGTNCCGLLVISELYHNFGAVLHFREIAFAVDMKHVASVCLTNWNTKLDYIKHKKIKLRTCSIHRKLSNY